MADFGAEMMESLGHVFGPFWPGAWKTTKAREYSRWNHVFSEARYSSLEYYAAVEELIRSRGLPEVKLGRVTWKERGLFSSRREYLRIERGRYVYDLCAAPFGKDYFFSSWLVILPRNFSPMHIAGMLVFPVITGSYFHSGEYEALYASLGVLAGLIPVVASGILRRFTFDRIELEDFLAGMTIVVAVYDVFFRPLTYFEQDTASMFEKSVHGAMMEVIDGLSEAAGAKAMTESERKPERVQSPLWVTFYRK